MQARGTALQDDSKNERISTKTLPIFRNDSCASSCLQLVLNIFILNRLLCDAVVYTRGCIFHSRPTVNKNRNTAFQPRAGEYFGNVLSNLRTIYSEQQRMPDFICDKIIWWISEMDIIIIFRPHQFLSMVCNNY